MSNLTNILNAFAPITLEAMENVRLMNRTDSKYVFRYSQLEALLQLLQPNYRVVEILGERALSYDTMYYDTAARDLYLHHHRGALNRYKIRHRTYISSGIGFLEVKFKNNHGRTNKERIKCAMPPTAFDNDSAKFIRKKTPFSHEHLLPVLNVFYRRITLVGKTAAERITFDLDLTFSGNGHTQKMDYLVIAEVKQPGKLKTPISEALRQLRIKEGGLSKYCMGMISVYPELKQNNFKRKLYTLDKLKYEPII